ncbi:uncharacterized protein LOC141908151 [Tubulanus polymorphus]|uniref:uncharacterized protein LOC141908151 n=1 Tax=Tubulanus polymorphus TaxID=672921 RepID=UPI003DA61D27
MDEGNETNLHSKVAQYGPYNISDELKIGDTKYWCRCGLSKKQPWCDGSHAGTGIKPMRWKVEKQQMVWELCGCKHTKSAPLCDGSHCSLPLIVKERIENCSKRTECHKTDTKLCTGCGWVPDF